jgi:N-acetylmuramoyl-L-alanine amidase
MDQSNNSTPTTPPAPHKKAAGQFTYLQIILVVAAIVATLFTSWTSPGTLPGGLGEFQIATPVGATQAVLFSTATPRPKPRIGIVAGHWSKNPDLYDPGAVCANGKTEVEVNQEIAVRVQQLLITNGYDVDLLEEFDSRLTGYLALALVSIHADSCEYINDQATGFKVAASQSNPHPEVSARLVACLQSRYAQASSMKIHPGSLTRDMTFYHAFSEIHNETAAAIIETGFLNLDYQILTTRQDALAQGIVNGILCFVQNESIAPQLTGTPSP